MADEADLQLESALNSLLKITEISGNLRKDLKKDIVDSISILRSIFVNLKNSAEENSVHIARLESEVKSMKTKLHETSDAGLPELGGDQGKLQQPA
jgi:signal transduction histidine kinase